MKIECEDLVTEYHDKVVDLFEELEEKLIIYKDNYVIQPVLGGEFNTQLLGYCIDNREYVWDEFISNDNDLNRFLKAYKENKLTQLKS